MRFLSINTPKYSPYSDSCKISLFIFNLKFLDSFRYLGLVIVKFDLFVSNVSLFAVRQSEMFNNSELTISSISSILLFE